MGISRNRVLLAWGTILLSCAVVAQAGQATPCGTAQGSAPFPGTSGLWLIPGGSDYTSFTVYDSNVGVCWLADANLAGDAAIRARVKLSKTNPDGTSPVINPDGTMDYETALNWVDALNSYDGGKGWLNHNNWQLPATPQTDTSCTSFNAGNFGTLCRGSALGSLYNVELAEAYPNSVAPFFLNLVLPFIELEPGLYWTSDSGGAQGQMTFSFNNGQSGANTTKYNWFHVLPMTRSVLGPLPTGKGVLPYTGGRGFGKAVYDTNTGISWTIDANLPAENKFGVTGTTPLLVSAVDGSMLTEPLINVDGTVYFSAIDPSEPTGWIVSMNKSKYAGVDNWTLPGVSDLATLYSDMGMTAGDVRLEWPFLVGPFLFFQPGFYWSCERDPNTALNAPCDPSLNPGTSPGNEQIPMQYSFNFDDGFLGTDENTKMFYVTAYYPAP